MKAADFTAVCSVPACRVCRVKGNYVFLVCAVNSAVADIYVIVFTYRKSAACVQISSRKNGVCCLENSSTTHGNYATLYYGQFICSAGVNVLIARCYNIADCSHFIYVQKRPCVGLCNVVH